MCSSSWRNERISLNVIGPNEEKCCNSTSDVSEVISFSNLTDHSSRGMKHSPSFLQ